MNDFGKLIVKRALEAKQNNINKESEGQANKNDNIDCKSRMDLIPTRFMREFGYLMLYGSVKYAENNWRKGLPLSRWTGAALRHLNAFQSGEEIDLESGIHHLIMVCFNCMAMYEQQHEEKMIKFDDRIKER